MYIRKHQRKEYADAYLNFKETKDEDGNRIFCLHSKQDDSIIRTAKTRGALYSSRLSRLDFLIEHDIHEFYSYRGLSFYGFSLKDNRWWVWDSRCKHTKFFGIGSEVKKFDLAYEPDTKENLKARALHFWQSDIYDKVAIENETEEGFDIVCYWSADKEKVKQEEARGRVTSHPYEFPETYGKGEWVAETLDDAKEMAIICSQHIV